MLDQIKAKYDLEMTSVERGTMRLLQLDINGNKKLSSSLSLGYGQPIDSPGPPSHPATVRSLGIRTFRCEGRILPYRAVLAANLGSTAVNLTVRSHRRLESALTALL